MFSPAMKYVGGETTITTKGYYNILWLGPNGDLGTIEASSFMFFNLLRCHMLGLVINDVSFVFLVHLVFSYIMLLVKAAW